MATEHDIEADLTLEISGPNIAPGKFLRGVRAFFGVLDEVSKAVCGTGETPQWRVQVKQASNLVGVFPANAAVNPAVVDAILAKVRVGIETLEARSEEPPDFPARAVRHLKELGKIEGEREDDDTRVRVWVKREPIAVTHKAVAHAIELLREAFEDHGSVEGRLQVVSERGSLSVQVFEPLWDRPIRCYLSEEKLKECLGYFGQRVEVFGVVRYRSDGTPISIEVEEVVPFPSIEGLPKAEDVRGIFGNYI